MNSKKLNHQKLLIVLLLFAVFWGCNFRENTVTTTSPSTNLTIDSQVHSELEKTNKRFSEELIELGYVPCKRCNL